MKLTLDYENFKKRAYDTQVRICETIAHDIDTVDESIEIGIATRTNSLWFANDLEITPEVEAFINEHFEFPSHVLLFIFTTLKDLK